MTVNPGNLLKNFSSLPGFIHVHCSLKFTVKIFYKNLYFNKIFSRNNRCMYRILIREKAGEFHGKEEKL